ncbi:MAG: SRPBCC family protein [Elusimicrobia bacterium]|nr:SRPBCC family protein [Elusimicrobiota bacterium]
MKRFPQPVAVALFTAMTAGCVAFAALAEPAEVSLRSEGGVYHLDGRFAVNASSALTWEVLTDYDGIGGFVSSILGSRVLRREPGGAVIEQVGSGRFLFFSRRVRLTLAVREEPMARVDFRELSRLQFRQYRGSWRIDASGSGCIVHYELAAEPDPSLGPRFIAKRVLKGNAQRLLDEVRAEIERRMEHRAG